MSIALILYVAGQPHPPLSFRAIPNPLQELHQPPDCMLPTECAKESCNVVKQEQLIDRQVVVKVDYTLLCER